MPATESDYEFTFQAKRLAQADKKGVPVRLGLLRGSPVESLYLRHGFHVARTTETLGFMERPVAEP